MHTLPATGRELLRTICERPEDDFCRLVFADWLEENGKSERAEFIRIGIEIASLETQAGEGTLVELAGGRYVALRGRERELLQSELNEELWLRGLPMLPKPEPGVSPYTFRRGFVAEVRTTTDKWCGTPCQRCNGDGLSTGPPESRRCPRCSGTGRVGGHGPAIVAVHPVVEVKFSDRNPRTSGRGEHCLWFRGGHKWADPDTQEDLIPEEWWPEGETVSRLYHECDTPAEAQRFISDCAVTWARSRAGLPPLRD